MARTNKSTKRGKPSQEVSDAYKASMEYGKEVSLFIQDEWLTTDGGTSRFYSQKDFLQELRSYASGEQNIERYKDRFKQDGDLSYVNLNWDVLPVVPKFVDVIVNNIQNQLFSIRASAQDPSATKEKKRQFDVLKAEMKEKDRLLSLQNATGVPQFENEVSELPNDDEELSIYVQQKLKPKIEIAAETSISHILDSNMYNKTIKPRIDRDQVEIGVGAIKHSFCPNEGIKVDYVDFVDMVYSSTSDPYFQDCYYFGEVKRFTISEVRKMFPNLSTDELDKISEAGANFSDYNGLEYINFDEDNEEDPNLVHLLSFCWKTTESSNYKIRTNKKGGKTAIKRDEGFEGPKTQDADFEKVTKIDECIYEGIHVLGADDLLLKWEKQENMVRPKSSTRNVVMPYIVCAPKMRRGSFDSIVSRITPIADLYQIAFLKLQQAIQRITPSGVYLDADGLAEIDLGGGTNYNPREALNMYFQTGSVIGRSLTVDGDRNVAKIPIQELQGGQGQQVQILLGLMDNYLNQIRQLTGVNEVREGQTPDERALVGTQKLAATNSATATRHIFEGGAFITERLAEAISLRLSDALKYWPLKDNLINSIGKANIAIIDELSDMHLHDFGVFLDLEPTEEERVFLEQNIQVSLEKDQIYLEDAIDIREIKNIKLANSLLKVRRKKKLQQEQDMQKQNQELQTQSNIQAAQAASQAKAQEYQAEYQNKEQLAAAEHQRKMEQLEFETQKQRELMDHEYELSLVKMGAEQAGRENDARVKGDEDRKTAFESQGYDSKPNGTASDKTFKVQ